MSRPRRGVTALGLAILVLAALVSLGSSGLAGRNFVTHMVVHLTVMLVAAPLAAFGLAHLTPVPRIGALTAMALSLFEMVVVWGWHLPALHEIAGMDPRLFAVQQGMFLLAGIGVWLPGLADRSRASAASGTVALSLAFMHMSMLGVILAISPTLFYAPSMVGEAFGLSPLDTQRLGGAIMALAGGTPYLAAASWQALRLISAGPAEVSDPERAAHGRAGH